MTKLSSPSRTGARAPARPSHGRQRALRWATVALLLLLAAVAASRV